MAQDKLWRHGDILIGETQEIPAQAKPRPDVILAHGEVSGHMHRIEQPDTAELWELNGVLFVKVVAETAQLVHEEHHPITLPRGIYRVWHQREYTPEKPRPVYD